MLQESTGLVQASALLIMSEVFNEFPGLGYYSGVTLCMTIRYEKQGKDATLSPSIKLLAGIHLHKNTF